jgi:hypothetical protein
MQIGPTQRKQAIELFVTTGVQARAGAGRRSAARRKASGTMNCDSLFFMAYDKRWLMVNENKTFRSTFNAQHSTLNVQLPTLNKKLF